MIIFQFGWASTQISHLAAIPDIASSQNERTGLTAIRYSMTVASNILVYLTAVSFLFFLYKSSYSNGLVNIFHD